MVNSFVAKCLYISCKRNVFLKTVSLKQNDDQPQSGHMSDCLDEPGPFNDSVVTQQSP